MKRNSESLRNASAPTVSIRLRGAIEKRERAFMPSTSRYLGMISRLQMIHSDPPAVFAISRRNKRRDQ